MSDEKLRTKECAEADSRLFQKELTSLMEKYRIEGAFCGGCGAEKDEKNFLFVGMAVVDIRTKATKRGTISAIEKVLREIKPEEEPSFSDFLGVLMEAAELQKKEDMQNEKDDDQKPEK